jgi:hypothetical protein
VVDVLYQFSEKHTKKKVIAGLDVPILMLHESFYFGSWEKTASSLLLPLHVSIVLRSRCGMDPFGVWHIGRSKLSTRVEPAG